MIRRRKPDRERAPQDHSWRCSMCGLNYWDSGVCQVCKGTLSAIANQPPDPDIDYHVALMLGTPPEADDKVFGWRMRELIFAGAPLALAEKVADDRSIDLHQAIGIVKDAGPDLAERILL